MKESIAILLERFEATEHQEKRVRISCILAGYKKFRPLPDGITLQDVAENICRMLKAKPLTLAVVDESSIVLILPMIYQPNLKNLK